MQIVTRQDVVETSSGCRLEIVHFARGVYPVLDHTWMPVNRIFIVLENPNGEDNYIETEQARYLLKPGWIYLVPSYFPTVFSLDEKLCFISIQFRMEFLAGVDLFPEFDRVLELHRPEAIPRIESIFRTQPTLASSIRLNAFVFDIAEEWFSCFAPEKVSNFSRFARYRELIAYIKKNCHAGVKVSELAAVCHLSREEFSRRFSAATGITPKAFFNRFLVRRATDLLLGPNLSVKDVAFEMGFKNEYYFSRFFHQHTGMPPGEFKKHQLRAALINETDISGDQIQDLTSWRFA